MNYLSKFSPGWLAYYITNSKWSYPPHIALLDRILVQASHYRKPSRIIVNLPPRHGKSELISYYLPTWYLGHYPDHRVILTSYEASFASSFGRKVRDLINDQGKTIFGINISQSSSSVNNFEVKDRKGGMSCVGAGGPITGKGANLMIIDDPIKNDTEANSPTYRENVWNWFKSTAYTRLEPNGIIILIMTRWNEDDLCGRLFVNENVVEATPQILNDIFSLEVENTNSNYWLLVKIPAIANSDDLLGREKGEALWKSRYPLDVLNNIKNTIGDYWFSALYQQEPSPLGGFIFKRSSFRYYEQDEFHFFFNYHNNIERVAWSKSECTIFATVDLAMSMSQTADFTAMIIFAVSKKNEIFILEVLRERLEPSEHLDFLNNIYKRWKPQVIGIEKVQYQTSLIQSALISGLPVKELQPDADKLTRALPMAARLESGTVYFPTDAHWLADFENELLSFPNGKYDDQVDVFAYIYQIIQFISGTLPVGKKTSYINKARLTTGF